MHFRRLPRHRLRFRGSGCARPHCAPSSLALEIRGIPEIFFDDALTRLAASRAPIFATQPPGDGTLVTAQYLIGNERSLLDSRSHDPANYGTAARTTLGHGEKNSPRAYIFRNVPDSCRKRAVPALTFDGTSGPAGSSFPAGRRARRRRHRIRPSSSMPTYITADCRRTGKGQAAVRVAHGSVPNEG
jgi:hypothetical protein